MCQEIFGTYGFSSSLVWWVFCGALLGKLTALCRLSPCSCEIETHAQKCVWGRGVKNGTGWAVSQVILRADLYSKEKKKNLENKHFYISAPDQLPCLLSLMPSLL